MNRTLLHQPLLSAPSLLQIMSTTMFVLLTERGNSMEWEELHALSTDNQIQDRESGEQPK